MPGTKKKPTAKSKSQRRLMGWAQACKSDKSDNCPDNVMKVADTMKAGDLESMAKTKEKGKPEKVKSKKESRILNYTNFINESTRTSINEDEFIELLKTKCSGYRHTYKEDGMTPAVLLRGTKDIGDYTLYNKSETGREPRLSVF